MTNTSSVTNAEVEAYLATNKAYWEEVDALPRTPVTKWRQGTPQEATRLGLEQFLQSRQRKANGNAELVVTKNDSGAIVSVTWQSPEGQIWDVVAESSQPSTEAVELPDPKYIYHDQQEAGDDLFVFSESGAVDKSDTYPNGVCQYCERLYTAEQMYAFRGAQNQSQAMLTLLGRAVLELNASWNRGDDAQVIAGHLDLCRRLVLVDATAAIRAAQPLPADESLTQKGGTHAARSTLQADAVTVGRDTVTNAQTPAAPVGGQADAVDAARYRWLRDRSPWTLMSANGITRLAARLPVMMESDADEANELNAAIDAAMSAKGE